jgi:ABC-2 type transport system ATP-binding protein
MKALRLENLHKTYPPHTVALRGISLTIEEGDFFALLGPNGAGKSTTIGIICSLVNKTSGLVEVFGHNIDTDWAAAKACIGVVPQEMNFNIFEKVQHIVMNQAGYYGMPRREAIIATEQALKEVDLWDKRNATARSLSGGMKRRLMIARAIVHRPKMLILDEPTAGVDIEVRRSMWKFLEKINRHGTTIILTTHYLEEAEHLCRNIAIIDEGQIIENTSMRKLLSTMQTQSFILELGAPLEQLPELPGFQLHLRDPETLEIELPNTLSLNEMFMALNSANIRVSGLRNKSNRLEELFVHLTGQAHHA